MAVLFSVHAIIPFFTLCLLELVLGIDNIIFISILSSKLPRADQQRARITGLSLAIFTRVGLLLSLSWLISLTAPLFRVLEQDISGRDLILLLGGAFLIGKSTKEIHEKMESHDEGPSTAKLTAKFYAVILQILLVDIVFSLDSVITAVGMVNELALSFLIMIGFTLIAEGLGQHISKGYIYFAMGFSLAVEFLNVRLRKRSQKLSIVKS